MRPLTGGDGGDSRPSKTRENFNPVACWQPALVTDANGQASAEFTLPDSMTAYRVFAVAVDRAERHGSVARTLVVKKPFYVEAGLPRFFTVGDKAKFFVAAFNDSGKAGDVTLKIGAQGGLIMHAPAGTFAVGASDRVQIPVEVEATAPVHTRVELEASLKRRRRPRRARAAGAAAHGAAHVRDRRTGGHDRTHGVGRAAARVKALSAEETRAGKVELALSPLPALRLVGGLQ